MAYPWPVARIVTIPARPSAIVCSFHTIAPRGAQRSLLPALGSLQVIERGIAHERGADSNAL